MMEWERLLYYVKGESLVRSEQFFISETGAKDSASELEATIGLLNSQYGKQIACNFPARYAWIRDNGYEVMDYDLQSCADLVRFANSFQKGRLSLVFASEHVDYPSSVFGHVFLLFNQNGDNILLGDSIQHVAETDNEPLAEYIFRGISGGYSGYFFREPFYIMKDTYSNIEQRALHIYDLDLSAERIDYLVYFLFELRKARFDYSFAKENCAYHIAYLLEVAYTKTFSDYKEDMSVMPVDVINMFRKNFTRERYMAPSLVRASGIINEMTEEERRQYNLANKGNISIDNILTESVKEVLIIEHEYFFKRYGFAPLNYEEAMALRVDSPSLDFDYRDIPLHGGAMVGLGWFKDGDEKGALLDFRLVGRDMYEFQSLRPRESKVVFMDSEFKAYDTGSVRLSRLDILGAKSLFNRVNIGYKTSWAMNLGINRENTLDKASFDSRFMMGHSYAGKKTGVGYLLGAGLQDNSSDGVAYIIPSIHVVFYPAENFKFGLAGFLKSGRHGRYEKGEIFLNIGIGKLSILTKYIATNAQNDDMLSFMLRHNY